MIVKNKTKIELRKVFSKLRDDFVKVDSACKKNNIFKMQQKILANFRLLEKLFLKNKIEIENSILSGYFPIKSELDILPILKMYIEKGLTISLPCVDDFKKPLIFREWKNGDKLLTEKLKTKAPLNNKKILEPDILIVPFLAFDQKGYRLGYGGGFYDMTIRSLKRKKKILTIGVGYSFQKIDALVTEDYDIALDMVITDKEIIEFN